MPHVPHNVCGNGGVKSSSAKSIMHCFDPRGFLAVQFAVGEALEIGKLDYPVLRIDFGGNEANPTQYRFCAKPRRQHVHVMDAVQHRNDDRPWSDREREVVYRGGEAVTFYAQKDNVVRGYNLSCGGCPRSNGQIAISWADNL